MNTNKHFIPTYSELYNESIEQAKEVLAITDTLPPKTAVEILLLFLIECSEMWYKAKCTANGCCIEQFAYVANGYAEGVGMIKSRIIELFNKKPVFGQLSLFEE